MVPYWEWTADASWRGWRGHEVHVNYLEPEAGDPLHQPHKGCLIWQLGPKGGRARADGDLAIVKFREQCGARLTRESDLVRLRLHQSEIPESVWLQRGVCLAPAC
jgi:hypothetical protein